MTTSDPLKDATMLLRDAIEDPGDLDALPPGREEAIARIAGALQSRRHRTRGWRSQRPPLLAAAVVLLAGGAAFAVLESHRATTPAASGAADAVSGETDARSARDLGRLVRPSGVVTVSRDGHSESVGLGDRVAEGAELRTPNGAEASLHFETGTEVTLGASSRVRLVEQTARKRFALEEGSLSAKVAKLGAGERFVVATPDAEVEVRGTAFRVMIEPGNPACEGGTPTRVEVTEGVVTVTHAGRQTAVAAGARWPATCDEIGPSLTIPRHSPARPAALPSNARSPASNVTAADNATATATANANPRPDTSSRLVEQNDLFDEAMRRKRAGDAPGAVAKLELLLAVYPTGPLAESAAAERMRIFASSDPPRAPGAARDYLGRHPRGFARAEAEAILAGAP